MADDSFAQTKLDLEVQKLRMEVRNLAKPWFRRHESWTLFLSFLVLVPSVYLNFFQYSALERRKLDAELDVKLAAVRLAETQAKEQAEAQKLSAIVASIQAQTKILAETTEKAKAADAKLKADGLFERFYRALEDYQRAGLVKGSSR